MCFASVSYYLKQFVCFHTSNEKFGGFSTSHIACIASCADIIPYPLRSVSCLTDQPYVLAAQRKREAEEGEAKRKQEAEAKQEAESQLRDAAENGKAKDWVR